MLDESVFKAYDIRGVYPKNLDEDVARDIGRAFVKHLELQGSRVVVARDMRLSGEALEQAFIEGVTETGADVLDLGLVSTDALYFAVGHLEEPGGAMVTASHNPKDYNGFKLCREEAIALSGDAGLGEIRDAIVSGELPGPAQYPGSVEETDITVDYAKHCLSFIDTEGLRSLKIVIDAGNGMAGKMLPPVFEQLPFEYVPMYFELDGSFPNHPPNPIEPENVREIQERVVAEEADFGVAFDGDADRCFVVDEKGVTISGDLLATLVAKNVLEKEPGATILYSAVCSKALPELVEREEGPLSDLLAPIDPYVRSGEINSEVEDQAGVLEKVEEHYAQRDEPKLDHLDGLTVDYGDWWFNLRPSNTEPLLRLNVEASDRETMERERDELLDLT